MSATGIDTIRLQIMWNRLISVVEEQAQTLMHTAFSPIVRECGDLSAGVFGRVFWRDDGQHHQHVGRAWSRGPGFPSEAGLRDGGPRAA